MDKPVTEQPTATPVAGSAGAGSAGVQASAGERISRLVFLGTAWALGLLVVFLAGVHFTHAKYWPYKPIESAMVVLGDAIEYGGFAPENAIGKAPEHATRDTWTAHDAAALTPGYRAVMGYLGEHDDFGVWLFDADGNQVHERILDYHAQDPDGPTGGSEAPHAFHFLPDGSVVVNTDKGDLMARYDTCGKAMWTQMGAYHHAFGPAPDGSVWTWLGETSAFDQYQYMVRFDPDTGETLQTIALIEDIIMPSARNRTIFGIVPGHEFEHEDGWRTNKDLFHPNDIEVLQPEMADAFPMFNAGDLLLSFRNIDLVTVIDPDSLELKWYSQGPWIQQHDPDFMSNGDISVYNNNRWRGDSSIITMNPQTRDVRTVDVEANYRFYSSYMGKHAYLDDGTLQVTVPYEGRVLEFDTDGELLLEINNLYSEQHNAFVADSMWLPEDFFTTSPAQFTCGDSSGVDS